MASVERQSNGTMAFPCFCCGVCCSGYQVQMSLEEAHRIAAQLKMTWQNFVEKYLDARWPGTRTLVLKHGGGRCIFLDQDADSQVGLCRIQAFKPEACIAWTASADRKECRQGLSRYWDLTIGEDGAICGTSEAIACFNTFLDSMTREES